MQLDACLRSIERFAPYVGPITVVYQATTPEFIAGYRMLDPGSRAQLVHQGDDFRAAVRGSLDPTFALTVFHTDDDLFFRRPTTVPLVPPGVAAFSLRLGENTTYCYPTDRLQLIPSSVDDLGMIAWNWARADGDFAYPMSLDGHVLSTEVLLQMLTRAKFNNPNELEEELHVRRHRLPSRMLAPRESSLVSVPANIVNATHANRAADDTELSAEALNVRFLAGDRIDIGAMDFSTVRGAHQEVAFVFTTPSYSASGSSLTPTKPKAEDAQ